MPPEYPFDDLTEKTQLRLKSTAGTVTRLAALLLATALCACGQSTSTPSPSPVGVNQWTIFGSGTGTDPPRIAPDSSGRWGFIFPAPNKSVNYVITKPSAVPQVGQTMTLNFSIAGNAVLVPLPERACGAQGLRSSSHSHDRVALGR